MANHSSPTRWLSEPAGIGRFDGEHGSRSRGEPFSGDVDLPSPRLCQTSALGHEIAIAWTTADRPSIRLRCCGQLQSSVKTDVAALTGNAALEDTAAGADVEPLTLLHSQNNTIIIQQMTTQTVVMKVSATNKRQNDCGSDKRPYSAPDCECITNVCKNSSSVIKA